MYGIRRLNSNVIGGTDNVILALKIFTQLLTSNFFTFIVECSLKTSTWMCLNCGKILCGRNTNRHALQHSEEKINHNICINTTDLSVFW